MSTLSISPALVAPAGPRRRSTSAPSPSPVSAPVRLTRRGRLVLVAGFLGLALALMLAFGGWATATRDSGPAPAVSVVTVAPGDTLYALAGRVADPGQVREMVHRITELNSLDSATLQPGQQIAVPRG